MVIADGSGSPWPQRLGLGAKQPQMATTMSVRLEGQGKLSDGTTRFEFGLVKQGFAWAFPLADGVNIGVGSFIGKQDADPEQVLAQLLPDLGFAADAGIRQRGKLRVWNGHHRLDGSGIVVVGDAASLCDPFLAEGLRPALMSGCEAARHLNLWLRGDSRDLRGYSRSMRERWGESMAWGRRIAQVFYRFPGVGISAGDQAAYRTTADCSDSLRGDGLWRHRPTGHQAAASTAQLKTEAELLAAVVGLLWFAPASASRCWLQPSLTGAMLALNRIGMAIKTG